MRIRKSFVKESLTALWLLTAFFALTRFDIEAYQGQWDLGDAPATYPTTLAANGSRHSNTQFEWLGTEGASACVNATTVEADAMVADLDNDDGLCQWWLNPVSNTAYVEILVSVGPDAPSGVRYLNALIDRDQDGDWQGMDEWAIINLELPLPAGACQFPVALALGAVGPTFPYQTWMRLTLTRSAISEVEAWTGTGEFDAGETEDWHLTFDPSLPPGRGGLSPGDHCPVSYFSLTCSPKNRTLLHGDNTLPYRLSSTGNVRPNRLKMVNSACSGCSPFGVFAPADQTVFEVAAGSNALDPANFPTFTTTATTRHPDGCLPDTVCNRSVFASYFNLSATVGPVGAAASSDICPCTVKHPELPASSARGGIKGKVMAGSEAIRGACISVIDNDGLTILMAYTKASGKFKTGLALPSGAYDVLVERAGFLSQTNRVEVKPDRSTKLNFNLNQPGAIEGQVALGGSFFDVFAEIEIKDASGKLIFKEATDHKGKYSTGAMLGPGRHQMTAMAEGYEPETRSVETGSGVTTANFDLRPLPPPPPDFSIACGAAALSLTPGSLGQTRITIGSINGFTDAVTLSCSGLPDGVSCQFQPDSLSPAANRQAVSTLTLIVSSSASPGAYSVQVVGASGGTRHACDIQLTVTAVPSFSLSCDPSRITTFAGGLASTTCMVTSRNGFSGPVDISCSGLPGGGSCGSQQVTPPPDGQASATFNFLITAPLGTHQFRMVGRSGSLTAEFPMQLIVIAPPFLQK
jgi:hypothetical protein